MQMTQPQIFHLLAIKGAVGLEMKGMKHSRGSAYAQAKRVYGIKGSRATVHSWLQTMFELQRDLKYWTMVYEDGVKFDNKEMVSEAEDALPSIRDAIEGMKQ